LWARPAGLTGLRIVNVVEPFDILATDIDQELFDPVQGIPIALCPLATIAELREVLERRLVVVEREATDEHLDRVDRFHFSGRFGLRERYARLRETQGNETER
jgi:hypothetical protein